MELLAVYSARAVVAAQGPSAEKAAPARVIAEPSLSIFHQPWWLDIATDRSWGEAVVREDGMAVGRLPYPIGSRYGMPVSTLPSLIRTLGPAIRPLPGKASTAFRRRLEITHALIGQLPRFAYFDHLLDPGITDGLAFVHRGYVLGSSYCFRIAAGTPVAATWAEMSDRRRRVVRRISSRRDRSATPRSSAGSTRPISVPRATCTVRRACGRSWPR
ncbi:MAG TPA: hypothetical protein VND19_15650 [Acetobacteraceae bacterium]|nr:hypothetical protein [Acetobacteraceae bacterium]